MNIVQQLATPEHKDHKFPVPLTLLILAYGILLIATLMEYFECSTHRTWMQMKVSGYLLIVLALFLVLLEELFLPPESVEEIH